MSGAESLPRVGQTVLVRFLESQILYQAAGSVALWQEDWEKGQWSLPSFLSWRKLSPALTLMPDTSTSPCVPLVPFKLLPQCWSSKGVSLSKFMCGSFKSNCLGLQKFLPLTQSPLVFAARSYGDLSAWHWNPGLEGPVLELGLLTPAISLPRYPS